MQKLDYLPSCPHICPWKDDQNYDFQSLPKSLFSKRQEPTLLRLKKRRFQCKVCRSSSGYKPQSLKNLQISITLSDKVAQLTEKVSLTDIARRLRVSTSTVYRKLDPVYFQGTLWQTPAVMSGLSLEFRKWLNFCGSKLWTNKLLTILDILRQTTIQLLFEVSIESTTKFCGLSRWICQGTYMPLARRLSKCRNHYWSFT